MGSKLGDIAEHIGLSRGRRGMGYKILQCRVWVEKKD